MELDALDIRPEQKADQAELRSVYERVYQQSLPAEKYSWWRQLNRHGSRGRTSIPQGLVARIDGQIAGYLGLRLRACMLNGQNAVSGEFVNGMVEPTFRRQGISSALCTHLVQHLKEWQLDLVYGIPNQMHTQPLINAGMKTLLTFGRWRLVRSSWRMQMLRASNKAKRTLGLSIVRRSHSATQVDATAQCALEKEPPWLEGLLFRNQRLPLDWQLRYDASPWSYTALKLDQGTFVLRLDGGLGGHIATLVEILPHSGTSKESLQKLLQAATETAWSNGVQGLEVRAIEGSSLAEALDAQSFERAPGQFPVIFDTADKRLLSRLNQDSLWMTTGDFDIG